MIGHYKVKSIVIFLKFNFDLFQYNNEKKKKKRIVKKKKSPFTMKKVLILKAVFQKVGLIL